MPLKDAFPKLYTLESNKDCRIIDRILNADSTYAWSRRRGIRNGIEQRELTKLLDTLSSLNLGRSEDTWIWKPSGNGSFSVQSLRWEISCNRWSTSPLKFSWCPWIPIKVNCFVWRLLLNRIPVAANLLKRGINVTSRLCPLCCLIDEDVNYLFFKCQFSKEVWLKICSWTKFMPRNPSSGDDLLMLIKGSAANRNLGVGLSTPPCGISGSAETTWRLRKLSRFRVRRWTIYKVMLLVGANLEQI